MTWSILSWAIIIPVFAVEQFSFRGTDASNEKEKELMISKTEIIGIHVNGRIMLRIVSQTVSIY